MSLKESPAEAAPLVWFQKPFKKAFADNELQTGSVIRNFRITAANGKMVIRRLTPAIPDVARATGKRSLPVRLEREPHP